MSEAQGQAPPPPDDQDQEAWLKRLSSQSSFYLPDAEQESELPSLDEAKELVERALVYQGRLKELERFSQALERGQLTADPEIESALANDVDARRAYKRLVDDAAARSAVEAEAEEAAEKALEIEEGPAVDEATLLAAYQPPPGLRPLPNIYAELGDALLALGDHLGEHDLDASAGHRFAQAVQAFRYALEEAGEEDAEKADLLQRLALAHERRGDEEDAMWAYLRAALLEPARAADVAPRLDHLVTPKRAQPVGARLLEQVGPDLLEAIELPAAAPLLPSLGRIMLLCGDTRQALAIFERSLEEDAHQPAVLEGLAEALWREDRREEALEHMWRACRQADAEGEPEAARAGLRRHLVKMLADSGEYEEALEQASVGLSLLESVDDPDVEAALYLLTARCLQATGSPAAAADAAESALALDANLVDAHAYYAEALLALGRPKEAAKAAASALELAPRHVMAQRVRAHALIDGGDFQDLEEAIRLLQVYTRQFPEAAAQQLALAQASRRAGRPPWQVADLLETALAAAPAGEEGPLLWELANLRLETDEFEKALPLLETLRETADEADLARWHKMYGQAQEAVGNEEQARAAYETALDLVKDDGDLQVTYARLLSSGGALEEAAEAWRRAIALEKDHGAYLNLARVLFLRNDCPAALEAAEDSLQLAVDDVARAQAYALQGDIRAALEEPAADVAHAYLKAGEHSQWANDHPEAIHFLLRARDAAAGLPADEQAPILWNLAEAYRVASYRPTPPYVDHDQIASALAQWQEEAAQMQPDAARSWVYVSRGLINEQLQRLSEAERAELLGPDLLTSSALWWQAAVFLLRAILLQEEETFRWTYLARMYRLLDLPLNALEAGERAVGLQEDNVSALEEKAATLANLGEFKEALKTIDRRLELESNTWAEGVRAYILLHSGQYQEALAAINGVIDADPDDLWNRGVRATIYLEMYRTEEALEEYRDIWQRRQDLGDDATIWDASEAAWAGYQIGLKRIARVLQFRQAIDNQSSVLAEEAGEEEEASGLGGRIRQRIRRAASGAAETIQDVARAYQEISAQAELRQAREVFSEQTADPATAPNAWRGLALCHLLSFDRSDFNLAREAAANGARLATNRWELTYFLDKRLSDLEATLSLRAADQAWQATVDEIRRLVEDALEQLPETADEELERMRSGELGPYAAGSWAWLGTEATVAYRHGAAGRWLEAADLYRQLLAYAQAIPEAEKGLEAMLAPVRAAAERLAADGECVQAAQQLQTIIPYAADLPRPETLVELQTQAGDWLVRGGRAGDARAQYDDVDIPQGDHELSAGLHARLGYASLLMARTKEAATHFRSALGAYLQAGVDDPGAALGAACRPLLADPGAYWDLDDFWSDLAREPQLKAPLTAARDTLRTYLDAIFHLRRPSGASEEMLPRRINVELGSELVPLVDIDDSPMLSEILPAMRERIVDSMGLRVPAVILSGNDYIGPTDFLLSLDGVPHGGGAVQLGKVFCLAGAQVVEESGVPAAAIAPASHPLTGAPACWVDGAYESALRDEALSYRSDPLEVIAWQLEALLRANLADFLGYQETESMLAEWATVRDAANLIDAALPDDDARLRLSRVLAALLRESVPIISWRAILEAMQSVDLDGREIWPALHAVRLRLREQLPANSERVERLRLTPDAEKQALRWLWRRHGRTFLALPPKDAQELLAVIGDLLGGRQRNVALIIADAELRPHLQRLVIQQFPAVLVVAKEELLPAGPEGVS